MQIRRSVRKLGLMALAGISLGPVCGTRVIVESVICDVPAQR